MALVLKYQPSKHKNTHSSCSSQNKLLGPCFDKKQNCHMISINVQFLVTIINIFLNASDVPGEARQAICIALIRADEVKSRSTLGPSELHRHPRGLIEKAGCYLTKTHLQKVNHRVQLLKEQR